MRFVCRISTILELWTDLGPSSDWAQLGLDSIMWTRPGQLKRPFGAGVGPTLHVPNPGNISQGALALRAKVLRHRGAVGLSSAHLDDGA